MSTDYFHHLRSFSAGAGSAVKRAQTLSQCSKRVRPFSLHTASRIDFDEMLDFGRRTGVSGLLGLDFSSARPCSGHCEFLQERKDALYSLSY